MNADVTPVRDALIGIWLFDTAGMRAQVSLAPDGTYTDTLVNGAQGHSGTWAVSNYGAGGHAITLTLKDWFPKEFVGPLASTTIIMPKTETWYVTGIQPNQIHVQGGILRRITADMPSPPPPMDGGGPVPPWMLTTDPNAEIAKELKQIADAGRKVAGFFGGLFKR